MNYNDLLKQFTETPAMNIGGHFGVVDNNKRNILARKDANFSNVMRAIVSTHKELLDNPEMLNKVAEMVKAEMNVEETIKTK